MRVEIQWIPVEERCLIRATRRTAIAGIDASNGSGGLIDEAGLLLDPAASQYPSSVVDHGCLAGRDCELGLIESHKKLVT